MKEYKDLFDRLKNTEAEVLILNQTNDNLNEEVIKMKSNGDYLETQLKAEASARDKFKTKFEKIEKSYNKLK